MTEDREPPMDLDRASIRTGCVTEANRQADMELRRLGYVFDATQAKWMRPASVPTEEPRLDELIEKHARIAVLPVQSQGDYYKATAVEANLLVNMRHILNRFAADLRALPAPEAAKNALARYGQHDSTCLKLTGHGESVRPCDCGFDTALAAAPLEARPSQEADPPDLMCNRCGYTDSRHWQGRCPAYGSQEGIFPSSGDVFADLGISAPALRASTATIQGSRVVECPTCGPVGSRQPTSTCPTCDGAATVPFDHPALRAPQSPFPICTCVGFDTGIVGHNESCPKHSSRRAPQGDHS